MTSHSSPRGLPLIALLIVGMLLTVGLSRPDGAAAATLTVTTTRDELAPHDRKCSLREALIAIESPGQRGDCARAGRGPNTIVLGSGRYVLSIRPTAPLDDATSGDLNVSGHEPLTIVGAGARLTLIDARRLQDRVLSVGGGARLTLSRLTITGGRAPSGSAGTSSVPGVACAADAGGSAGGDAGDAGSGGGIFNAGSLSLEFVAVTGNTAGAGGTGGSGLGAGCTGGIGGRGGNGGGVFNRGRLAVVASTIAGNRAGAGGTGGGGAAALGAGAGGVGGSGGGIANSGGSLTVINSTVSGNVAGVGGAGGAPASGSGGAGGSGGVGAGGNGGGIAVVGGPSRLLNATVAGNRVGTGGAGGSIAAAGGAGGGVFVQPARRADAMRLQNTIVVASVGANCAGSTRTAIENGGGDVSFGDRTCPGWHRDPKLGPLKDNGGLTDTMAIRSGSPAVDAIAFKRGGCPAADQRGVRRPEGRACDAGAYEFAIPRITIAAPFEGASYERGTRIRANFVCDEGGVASTIASCTGSVARGRAIGTARLGLVPFIVTAIDKTGTRARRRVRYEVWVYVNPLREVSGLTPRRIDLGVDYAGTGPLLAIGRSRITTASNTDSGPSSCWAISCWPGGGIVVMRLLDGPFAGKYVYVAEHITVNVRAGQTVNAGQRIATLYAGYPWSEWGWAAGPGPEALGIADGHSCQTCPDIGDWSTIEGRNMNALFVRLGAPSGLYQPVPNQSMPPGWPTWPR